MSKQGTILTALVMALTILAPTYAMAYVGPGAGLGMIGSLIAVVVAVVVAILGIIIFPFRILMKRRKNKLQASNQPVTDDKTA
ncbi:MAG: hypothetical protein AAFY56_16730 [Pseudomonadota bacterium]